jgi:hypothetical protein
MLDINVKLIIRMNNCNETDVNQWRFVQSDHLVFSLSVRISVEQEKCQHTVCDTYMNGVNDSSEWKLPILLDCQTKVGSSFAYLNEMPQP